jgi:serpin B
MEKSAEDTLNSKIAETFNAIISSNRGENVVTSPLSILSSFAVLSRGLTGHSSAELAKVFGLADNSVIDLKIIESLNSIINNDNPDITIKIDNCLYTNRNVKIKPEFVELIKQKYSAQAESLDFSDPKTVKIINDKITESTEGMVTTAVQKLNSSAFAILVNTMYFYGEWQQPFSEEATMPMDFHKSDGTKVEAMFMSKPSAKVSIKDTPDYAYLSISYKSDKTKFVIEMAKSGKLTRSNSKAVMEVSRAPKKDVDIFIPKFKASFNCDMVPILKSLGITRLFSASKEFKKITDHQMCISSIYHNACIEVDELGTKMVMFTISVMDGEISSGMQIPKFVADKPFFFHIVDSEKEVMLFSGTLEEPNFS